MRRRELIGFAGTALFAWPLLACAQQAAETARVGYLGFGIPAASANRVEALRAGLRDLGYVEGKNLIIEFRWPGTVEQMHEAAAELARMKVLQATRFGVLWSPTAPSYRPVLEAAE